LLRIEARFKNVTKMAVQMIDSEIWLVVKGWNGNQVSHANSEYITDLR